MQKNVHARQLEVGQAVIRALGQPADQGHVDGGVGVEQGGIGKIVVAGKSFRMIQRRRHGGVHGRIGGQIHAVDGTSYAAVLNDGGNDEQKYDEQNIDGVTFEHGGRRGVVQAAGWSGGAESVRAARRNRGRV